MSAWTAFGFGALLGALLFDQLWRHVRRLERRLREWPGEVGYYTKADVDAAYERVRYADFELTDAERAASAIEARRAETQGGSVVDESAVGDSRDAHPQPGPSQ